MTAEYIEREAVKQKIAEVQDEGGDPISGSQYEIGYHNGLTMAYTLAITAPAADVVPVVHGRWIGTDKRPHLAYKCSACEAKWYGKVDLINYCPNCGARMDGTE